MNWRSLGKWLLRQQKKDVEPVGPIEVKLYKHDIYMYYPISNVSAFLTIYNNTNVPITKNSLLDFLNTSNNNETSCTGLYTENNLPIVSIKCESVSSKVSFKYERNKYIVVSVNGFTTFTDNVSEITLSN